MIRQYELVERVRAYDADADEDLLNRAYVFAMKAHGSQKRASGDPYFSHPIEVAGILTGFKLDVGTIATALLHDVIEDTDTTLDQIDRLFGKDIARLVDGVTKLTRIELQSDQTKHAENFRKLVLAMSDDIRVLLVKLADRLHNMRTIHFISTPAKRERIARETMEIYAPLAERIGMHEVKDELEDLAFAQLHGDARDSILQRLAFLSSQGENLVPKVLRALETVLTENGVPATLAGRQKSPYSIWRKMRQKNIGFEQLSDIMAFRVQVTSVEDCYRALGVIHSTYPVVPGRFKDYISTPKPNGYRSLHTGVIGPLKQRIEMQIRTAEMDEVAELGVAAHWSYKQGGPTRDGRQYRWLRELLDLLEHAASPDEFLEHTKLQMFQDQVFCFTPKGDVIALPKGATPIDFAYAVHSEIGDRCVGAKINGRMARLGQSLANGDQVEIITSRTQTPSPNWADMAVTAKVKARIRRYVRQQQRQQYVALGKEILQKVFRQEAVPFAEKSLEAVLKQFKAEKLEDLFATVGEGNHTGREVLHAVAPHTKPTVPKSGDEVVVPITRARKIDREKGKIALSGLIPGMAFHYGRCCHPLPGDRIVGIVQSGKGVTIHTIDCTNLEQYQDTPERWLDVGWTEDGTDDQQVGRLAVVVHNEPGSMGSLCTVIGQNRGNISNLKIVNRQMDFFELLVDIQVDNVRHLTNIIAALRATPAITSVDRARG
jgi:GTP pyrophosphokinase